MNYIISILAFALTSVILFLTSNQFEPTPKGEGGLHDAFFVVGIITGVISIIFVFVALFTNMDKKQEFKKLLTKLKRLRSMITMAQEDLSNYKKEFEETLTKSYPEYEKGLFKEMNPSDSETLSAIMVKYPEIKFNSVLNEYVVGIKQRLKNIYELKEQTISTKEDLQDMVDNGWRLVKLEIPKDI